MPRQYKFYFHYHRQKKKWSIHFRSMCHFCDLDKLMVIPACWGKKRKSQPFAVMEGYCSGLDVLGGITRILP